MNNCGFSEEKAKAIEARYHELYKVADEWLNGLIQKAKTTGYIPLAFGGRIRTPLLKASTTRLTPIAQKEARSAGNAATQSYCALTLRALIEFMERVWDSPYKHDILPVNTIHDANYLLVRDQIGIVHWVNQNLIDCMAWQELPELQHPDIKLTANVEIYWPDWNHKIKIPNNASKAEIKQLCSTFKQSL